MKKSFSIFAMILALGAVFSACEPEDQPQGSNPATTITLDPTSLENVASSGVEPVSVTVTADGSWSVVNSAAWLEVSPLKGDGNGTITVTVQDNWKDSTELAPRSASFTVGSKNTSAEFTVSQNGNAEASMKTLPYSITFLEDFADWTIENITLGDGLTYVWSQTSQYGMKASAYTTTQIASESWLVSPIFDLRQETAAILGFEHAINKGTPDNEKLYVKKTTDEQWTAVAIPSMPEGNSWNFMHSGDIDLSAWCGNKIQIGFQYVSQAQDGFAATWEVKNFEFTNSAQPKFSVEQDTVKVSASTTTASITVKGNVDWTVACPDGVSAEPASGNGQKTVELTFPANEKTEEVSYEITVSTTAAVETASFKVVLVQAAKSTDVSTVAEVLAATEAGGAYNVNGLVASAIQGSNVIAYDETGAILLYKSDHGLEIGDVFNISDGAIGEYNGVWELKNFNITKTGETKTPEYGTPVEILTDEQVINFTNPASYTYIHFRGILKEDGKNRTWLTEGGEKGVYLATAVSGWSGKLVDIYGYANGVMSTFGTITTTLVKIEEVASEKSLSVSTTAISVDADSTKATFTVNANCNWTASCANATSVEPASGNDTTLVTVTFPANTSESAVTYEVTVSTEDNAPVKSHTVTITQAAPASEITTVAGIVALATSTTEVEFTAKLTGAIVTYVSGNNAFIEDASGAILLFKSGHGLVAGKKIDGEISGKIKIYYGLPEMTSIDVSKATLTDVAVPAPAVITIADLLADFDKYVSRRMKIVGVTVTKDCKGSNTTSERQGEISQNGSAIMLFSQIKNTISILKGWEGDVIGYPTRNNDKKQFGIWQQSDFTQTNAKPELTVEKDTIVVSASATSATLKIGGNVDWTVQCPQGITADPSNGTGAADVALSFNPNNGETEILSTITVSTTAEVEKKSIAVVLKQSVASEGGDNTLTLTFVLSKNPGGWPTANSTTLTDYTYTLDGTDYTFGLKNVKSNSGYLMLTSTAALGLPAIDGKKLTKVVAKNTSGCSTAVKVGISSSSESEDYVPGGGILTWSKQSSTYTYDLTETSTNTVYYMYVTNKNAQITELTLTYEK